jgi:hypothetical protein
MNRSSIALAAIGSVLLAASGASAQTEEPRAERSYLGVFGGGVDQFEQVLTVNGSAGVGYDTSPGTGATEAGLLPPPLPLKHVGTVYDHLAGGLSYTASVQKLSVDASLSSALRQYPQSDLPDLPNYGVSLAAGVTSISLGKKTSLGGSVGAVYQSTRAFMPFPVLDSPDLGPIEIPTADYGTGLRDYSSYNASASISHQLSRRSSLSGGYSRHSTLFGGDGSFDDLAEQNVSFRYSRSVTRDLGLRLGYGYTEAVYGQDRQRYQNHSIDTGVDYNRALSLTRRTKLAFSTGGTAIRQDQQTRYDVIGSAVLSHEIGRTWNASLSYQRNVGFTELVLQPVFSDAVSASLGGLITRKLTFQSGVGTSRGSVGVHDRASNGFDAWSGFAGVNRALTRYLALGVSYSYYHYNFQPGASLVTGLTPNMNHHSVSVALNAWAPVFQHGRKQNASR